MESPNNSDDQVEGYDYYLPKPLMMVVASYLSNYELCKLYQSCSYFLSCVQSHCKILYLHLHQNASSNQSLPQVKLIPENPKVNGIRISVNYQDDQENWFYKYAQLSTRKTFQISSLLKLNPHEPEIITKDLISTEFQSMFGNKVIGFYQGGKLNACLSCDGSLIISIVQEVENAFVSQIINTFPDSESIIIPEKVLQVAVGASDLAYIDEFGMVKTILYQENNILSVRYRLKLDEKAKLVGVGQGHSFVVGESNQVYSWAQCFHTEDDKPTLVQGIKANIIDIKSGNVQTILLTSDHTLIKIDHPLDADMPFKAQQIRKLSNIIMISSTLGHFLALERLDSEPIQNWNHQKVAEWFHSIGLGDSSNIIKYKQINGEIILNADEDYLSDTLGITQLVKQHKFRIELSKVKEGTIGECTLYGWGLNTFGQLGLIGSNVPEPKVIPLPDFQDKNDFVTAIECGKRNSAVISNQGEIWITGNYKPNQTYKALMANRKESKEDDLLEFEEKKLPFTAKGKKAKKANYKAQGLDNQEVYQEFVEDYKNQKERLKQKKNHLNKYVQGLKESREVHKKENDRELNLKHRWINFTSAFSQQAFGKSYKILNVSLCNRNFVAICCYNFSKGPRIVNKYKEGMKFKGGDQIIKKLLFQSKIHENKKYTVCYEDRMLGVVETEVDKFYYQSEIPLHRIKLFKCNGEIIWDRKNKFSAL